MIGVLVRTLSVLLSFEISHRPALAQATLASALDAKLSSAMAEHHIPGLAVAVIVRDRIVYSRTLGVADLNSKKPVTPRSVFHLASITKTFVGTALMQLQEQKKLTLRDKVATHVSYFSLRDPRYEQITVGQMASHISGMPDFDSDPWTNPSYDDGALERFVRTFVSQKHLTTDPGSRYAYSNTAYEVLGDVIAKASGQSFESYVAQHILLPLKMTDSTLLITHVDRLRLVAPHYLHDGKLIVSPVFPYNRMHGPSSTMLSTLNDMVRYVRAYLLRGELDGVRILSTASIAEMWRPAVPSIDNVGVSWHLDAIGGQGSVQHGGSDVGFKNFVMLLPDQSVGLVLLTNSIETPSRTLASEVMRIVLDHAAPAATAPEQRLLRDIFRQLVEIDTSRQTTSAALAMAARLRAAGFPSRDVVVTGQPRQWQNLVVRLRGKGTRRPLLLLAHLDVVPALRSDWSVDPFKLQERDGYFYGRGTTDDKAMAAIFIANLIRLKQEKVVPDRDIIVALTADEEVQDHDGVVWLLKNRRDLIDAELCLNEGGDGQIKDGVYLANEVQASEKIYLTFFLEVKNAGGHSSIPVKENAIYRLAEGLTRLSKFQFPFRLNEVTRAYFRRLAEIETKREKKGEKKRVSATAASDMVEITRDAPSQAAIARISEKPYFNALVRTSCVATRLEAGHANDALPQTAQATVNCRILPEETPEEVQRTLVKIVADEAIAVRPKGPPDWGPTSPLDPALIAAVRRATEAMWPGVPVIPTMSPGMTDGVFLRHAGIPTYGVSGIFGDIDDVRAHGKDERVGVRQLFEGQTFLYRIVKELAGLP